MDNSSPAVEPERPWLELAKLNQESRFNRRGYEWKLALEFWGFAIGVPVLVQRLDISADQIASMKCQVVSWYILAGLSFVLSSIATHLAYTTDLRFIRFYTDGAIGEKSTKPGAATCCCMTTSILWLLSKLLFTIAVLWASFSLLLATFSTDVPKP